MPARVTLEAVLVPAPSTIVAPAPESIGSPWLWVVSILVLLGLLVTDFVVTRRSHDVSMREAVGWSAFYLTLPLGFGFWLWFAFGGNQSLEFITGFVVEKSLSVDNLFVFILLLTAFAVPTDVQQRVLLYGIVGALVLRGIFIAAGAALLQAGSWALGVPGIRPAPVHLRRQDSARRAHRLRTRT